MHMLVSNGVMNFELSELFQSIGFAKAYADMNNLISKSWQRPFGRQGNSYKSPFDEAHKKTTRSSPGGTFKCMASELLSILPLVRVYVDGEVASSKPKEAASFRACHDMVCLYLRAKDHGEVDDTMLDRQASIHMQRFTYAYGVDRLKPEHHQTCFHFAENVRKKSKSARNARNAFARNARVLA